MVSVWCTVSRAVHVAVCRCRVVVSWFSVVVWAVVVEALVACVVEWVWVVFAAWVVVTVRRCVAQERQRKASKRVRYRMVVGVFVLDCIVWNRV